MLYKKSIFLAVCLFLNTQITVAQTKSISLNWLPAPKVNYLSNGLKKMQPTFLGASHGYKNGFLPVFSIDIPLQTDGDLTVQLQNEIFEPVTNMQDEKKIITENVIVKSFLTVEKKKFFASINFVPVRKNAQSGIFEKLISADLKITVNPSSKNVSRKTDAYASHSVLASGTWFKIAVNNAGVFKLDYEFMKTKLGINLDNFSLNTIGVFGNGGGMVPEKNAPFRYDDLQEIASFLYDKNGNNKMDAEDYILFYTQGPDSWSFNATSGYFEHQKNLYADKNFLFVSPDRGSGKRVSAIASDPNPTKFITEFDDYAFRENDQYNMLGGGKRWFGDRMSSNNSQLAFSLNFPNLITSKPVFYRSDVVANGYASSNFQLSVNSQNIYNHSVAGIATNDYPDGFEESFTTGSLYSSSDNLSVNYAYTTNDPNSTAFGYLDYFEVNVKRKLAFTGNSLAFRATSAVGAGNVAQYTLNNLGNNMQVWEVTDPTSAKQIQGSFNGSDFTFSLNSNSLREFVAVNTGASFDIPEKIGAVDNQDLHGIGQPSLIILCPDIFLNPANDLADFHRTHDGLLTKVVTTTQVFNEFGAGKKDISAIRDFMRMLYENAGSNLTQMPQYLCLFGDGSYDPKDRVPDNNNLIPTYQSDESKYYLGTWPSDDFYGCLDPTEGGDMNSPQKMDIAVGRIPSADVNMAAAMVSKFRRYKSVDALGAWRNMITTIGDDEDGDTHQNQANVIGETVRLNDPAYNVEKIFLDAYQQVSTPGGSRYPDVNAAILNRISDGALIISWTGHGGVKNWAHERIFNISDIQTLNNSIKLPLFLTATCEFSMYDNPSIESAGEALINNYNGGGIALITTVRPVYSSGNERLQDSLLARLFVNINGRKPTLGELMAKTKNAIIDSETDNTRKFVLLGDPALQLDYPSYNMVTTMIDSVNISQPHDTLKALKYVTINGQVKDWSGNVKSDFNGTCYPLVYDKLGSFTTLGNDPGSPIATYPIYKNQLFKGACSVINGNFQFSFIVPKDINYQIGNGRISYYAENTSANIDAQGYQNDVVIGGSANSFANDKTGPKIKLYMNDEKFVYGGMTSESPKLLAKLEDESGINTTGNGLGHDISAVIDQTSTTPIILNSFYQSDLNNFRKGKVLYPFTKLKTGRHTLSLKAWDIYNNSSEDNTEFVVASSAKVALSHVLNYPNPFTTNTSFMFEHNRPGDALEVSLQIFTVAGRLVKTIQQQIISEGFRVNDIKWNGRDDFGDRIGKGVYVYKISVRDSQGNTAHQFEKLVILQ